MKTEGMEEALALLYQTGDRVTRGVVGRMRVEAEAIEKLAREYAPIDHGNLEQAIKIETLGGGRDSRGRFVRKAFEVFIDMSATGHHGEPISKYAYEMHELLLPYGAGGFNLGPLSRQKDGDRGVVGGRFLERAVDEVSKRMMDRLIHVAASYF